MPSTSWPLTTIRSLVQPISLWNPATQSRQTIRYVDVSSVSRERLAISAPAEMAAVSAPSRARKVIKKGDTLFATIRPGLKRVAQVPDPLDDEIASTAFCVLSPNRDLIDEDFLYFTAHSDAFVERVA